MVAFDPMIPVLLTYVTPPLLVCTLPYPTLPPPPPLHTQPYIYLSPPTNSPMLGMTLWEPGQSTDAASNLWSVLCLYIIHLPPPPNALEVIGGSGNL